MPLRRRRGERIADRIVFDPEEFDSALDDLEVRLERLNLLYERFFSGSERTEPAPLKNEIDHQLAQLLLEQKQLGALSRVRLTLVHQRYDAYQQCWERLAGRANSGARSRLASPRDASRSVERATRVLGEPTPRSEIPRSLSHEHLVTPVTGLEASFSRSSRPPPAGSALTPPLGTPSSAPLRPPLGSAPNDNLGRSVRPESSRTIRDFRPSLASDSAHTTPDLRPPFEAHSSELEAVKTEPRLPLPFSLDSSSTTPYLRLPEDESYSQKPRTPTPLPSTPDGSLAALDTPGVSAPSVVARPVSMDRVREIHAHLRASNARPPSLERLAKRLSETEAKLRALHGDRTVTFDVILRNGKAIVKPIVH